MNLRSVCHSPDIVTLDVLGRDACGAPASLSGVDMEHSDGTFLICQDVSHDMNCLSFMDTKKAYNPSIAAMYRHISSFLIG